MVKEYRHYIKSVAEVLLLTATQNIAQRGHRESEEDNNQGNFLAILQLLANHDPVVEKKLNGMHNAKYTSHQVQNEVLDILAEMVRSTIIKEVKDSQVFALLADETKDIAKKEQMSIVLRYYYNGEIKESFLHFEALEQLDAAELTKRIVSILERYGLEYRENLVGQAYDGASVMRGKNSGVQARLKELANKAFYVHCNAHCLNLVLVDTVKVIPEVDNFFTVVQKLYNFMSGSYVHPKWLNMQKRLFEGTPPRELQKLSDTRWACRQKACQTILDRLPAIICVLEELVAGESGDRSVEARSLLALIDVQFVALLVTIGKLFGEAKCHSDALQSQNLDLGVAVYLVEALVDSLQSFRNEEHFEGLWRTVIATAQACNIDIEPAKSRTLLSQRLDHAHVMSTLGGHSEKNKDTFKIGIFYPTIDVMLSEIERRFSKPSCTVMRGIEALNPKSNHFSDEEALLPFAALYDCNAEDLTHELHQFKRILDRKIQAGTEIPSSILDVTKILEPNREIFHELFRLYKIAVTLPVSTASCERSFSALKLIKTYLRSTMGDQRLNNLGVLSVESSRSNSLNLDEFVNHFAHTNRRIQL